MDKTAREVKVTPPFSCSMFKFSFICNYYNLCYFEVDDDDDETLLRCLKKPPSLG